MLRQSASNSGAVLYYIPDGSIVYVNSDLGNGWYNVTYSGITGYMLSSSISYNLPTATPTPVPTATPTPEPTATPTGYLGTLEYWSAETDNSDNIIGRWDKSVQVKHTDLLSGKFVYSCFSNATLQWNNAGVSCSMTTSETEAEVMSYGGTFDQLSQITHFSAIIQESDYGRSTMPSYSVEGNWYYDNNGTIELKEGLLLNGSSIKCYAYIIIKENDYDDDYPSNFMSVANHEMGHALGWFGHSLISSDVMSNGVNLPTTLTDRDKQHLTQIYPY